MRSVTSSEGSQLVRTVGPCAQTRVAIEAQSRTRKRKAPFVQEAC